LSSEGAYKNRPINDCTPHAPRTICSPWYVSVMIISWFHVLTTTTGNIIRLIYIRYELIISFNAVTTSCNPGEELILPPLHNTLLSDTDCRKTRIPEGTLTRSSVVDYFFSISGLERGDFISFRVNSTIMEICFWETVLKIKSMDFRGIVQPGKTISRNILKTSGKNCR
jgi:hypothetical protein